ncbi:MAG: DUF4388 domain-containing protein [Acidobacteriota bacterium]
MTTCSNSHCKRPKLNKAGRCLSCQALSAGTLIRHYKIEQMVGKGGFGITYLVSDRDCFDQERILKELSPQTHDIPEEDLSEELLETIERLFKREAQVLLNLQHSGIPKLYAYFIENDYSYLVQDYILGQTLIDEVNDRKQLYDEAESITLLTELADILEYLHTRTPPIIHRDIKPENLMHHANGQLLLIDFGAVFQAANSAVKSKTVIGSPGYAPPEQLMGQPMPQSDLYAAGTTLLRLLTGLHPSKFFNSKTQRLEWEQYAQISPRFAAIINELVTQDVNKRLASATILKQRLRQLTSTVTPSTPANDSPNEIVATPPAGPVYPATELATKAETGNLEQVPVLFLLSRFYRERLSGSLTCTNGEISKTIFFDKGVIVLADSSIASEQLSELLIRIRRINIADQERVQSIIKAEGIDFGSALVKLDCITSEELEPFIVLQVSNIVYSLFNWSKGRYQIRPDHLPERATTISLSTADMIFESLRRLENTELLERWLGDLARIVIPNSDPTQLYQVVNLTPKEAFIASRIDSTMTLEQIVSLSGMLQAETLKTLCGLLAVGMLELIDRHDRLDSSMAVCQKPNTEPTQPPLAFDITAAAAFCYEVEHTLRNIDNASHYAVLGVERSASVAQIQAAYIELAEKFHPDRHAQLASYNLSLRTELEKISARISAAYHVLNDQVLRDDYDRSLRRNLKVPLGLPKPA